MGTEEQILGLRELYRPLDREPVVDIVAVHGLMGDASRTWISEDKQICWLQHAEFLPRYVPDARVLTYGYNANVVSMKGKKVSSDRVLNHAQTLVADLYANRQLDDGSERPIIFICHSLGGIVVKRALAYSNSRIGSKVAHINSIFTCTYGILFFGTPHNGSDRAELAGNIRKIVSAATGKMIKTAPSLLKALEEDSDVLQEVNDQFEAIRTNFRVYFFWEEQKTSLKVVDFIVGESSAAPVLDGTERCGIPANHRQMCRFDDDKSQRFPVVAEALKRYSRDAPGAIRTRVAAAKAEVSDNKEKQAQALRLGF